MGSSWCQPPASNSTSVHGLHSHSQQWTVHLSNIKGQGLLRCLPRYFHGCWYGPWSGSDLAEIRLARQLRDLDQSAHPIHRVRAQNFIVGIGLINCDQHGCRCKLSSQHRNRAGIIRRYIHRSDPQICRYATSWCSHRRFRFRRLPERSESSRLFVWRCYALHCLLG